MQPTDKYIKLFEDFSSKEKSLQDYFLEKDSSIFVLINDLKLRWSTTKFKEYILGLHRANLKKEESCLLKKIEDSKVIGKSDLLSTEKHKSIVAELENLNFDKFEKYYKSIYNVLSNETNIFTNDISADDYVAFEALSLIYEFYLWTNRFSTPKDNNLEKTYSLKYISLKEIDKQYDKYQLLSIDENFTFADSNIPQVYDKRIEKYILIKEISKNLLDFFEQLIDKGFIGNIAIRPDYSLFGDGRRRILEELEKGEIFSFEKLGTPLITKLYSKSYDSNLWIIIDAENMTFEEILDDFDMDNELIVTQVVHLEYKKLEDLKTIIVHLDHEYIFYTLDEYTARQNDPKQKGNAKKRYKTFKIDNSKIPFVIDDLFVLYRIIESFFVKKELIEEYFQDVMKT